ncbi:MAG: hypothetical protein QQW96_03855 [Tychonema bourrellyi B0820]|nr:hypothetical protein [Tychonema bourrellyi B0820]PJE45228.1 MAG: hypothetical protein CUR32_01100 [Flavobacterium sp.] [Flavobacterium sp. FEMGT703F]
MTTYVIQQLRAKHAAEKANLAANHASQKKLLNDEWARTLRLAQEEKIRNTPKQNDYWEWQKQGYTKAEMMKRYNDSYKVQFANTKQREKAEKASMSARHKSEKTSMSARHKAEIANSKVRK